MMMKKAYEMPISEIVRLCPYDVLTGSTLSAMDFSEYDRVNFNNLV